MTERIDTHDAYVQAQLKNSVHIPTEKGEALRKAAVPDFSED